MQFSATGKPDDTFGGNCRAFEMNRCFQQAGPYLQRGCRGEFYLFENDDRGRPTRIPIDFGGYFDVVSLDAGEKPARHLPDHGAMGLAPAQPPRERPRPERSTATMQAPPRPPTT